MKLSLIATIIVGTLLGSTKAATLLVGYDDFKSTSDGAYSIAGSYTTADGKLLLPTGGGSAALTDVVITGGYFSSKSTAGSSSRMESIVTMTISNFTVPSSGIAVVFEGGQANTGQWGMGINSAGQFVGLWGNGQNGVAVSPSGVTIDWTKPVTLTASTSNAGTIFYVNGINIGVIGGLKASGGFLDRLYLGGNGYSSGSLNRGNFTIDNLYVHGGTMTDDEVKEFVKSIAIPEPSTATLGVLGFAFLMLRRRK